MGNEAGGAISNDGAGEISGGENYRTKLDHQSDGRSFAASKRAAKVDPRSARGGLGQSHDQSDGADARNSDGRSADKNDGTSTSGRDGQRAAVDVKPQEKATSEEKQEAARKLKAMVNGREVEVDEQTLLRDYQRFASADEIFREAAKARKEVEEFRKRLSEDPEAALSDPNLSIDRLALAEKWLTEDLESKIQPEKSAEQKRIEELERELAGFKGKEEQSQRAAEEAEFNELVTTRKEALAKTFQDALALTPLSKNPDVAADTVREMASYMRMCKEAGYSPDAKDIAAHIEKKYMGSFQALTSSMSGEDLINFLGKGILKKLRDYDLAQLESRYGQTSERRETSEPRQSTKGKSFVDPRALLRG